MDDFTRRALAAYFRSGNTGRPQPRGLTEYEGRKYVVLRNEQGGLLAIYRVRNDGMLKRLKRWPAGLAER